jgi:uncharacterized protein YndB with AHSA1/START domain
MPKIRHLFHIDASVHDVFEHISKIEHLRDWWTVQTSGSDQEGGTIDFRFGDKGFIQIRVDELVSGEKIVWTCTDGDPEWHGTTIQFHLSENDEKCKVDFVQDGFLEITEFIGLCNFSWAGYFVSLRSLCEGGEATPYKE